MTLLAINWGNTGMQALQFILSFSILVTLHELGHFLTARWFKCRVEKFYLFFNPWFSLWKKKIGETEYGFGWVPFGGYVKISGMIDESMDKEQLKLPPQPYEFRSKPAWQRLIIMLAGIVVNLILGFLIYAMMLWHWGEEYIPTNKMTYGIATDSLSQSIGLKSGDKILTADGQYIDKFDKIRMSVLLNSTKNLTVDRNGEKVNIAIPDDFSSNLIHFKDLGYIGLRVPFTSIDSLQSDTSAAAKAGLKENDKVLAVNGKPIIFFDEFRDEIVKNKKKTVDLTILRGADTLPAKVLVPETGIIGIANNIDEHFLDSAFEVKKIDYTFLTAVPAGFRKSYETLESYWLQLKLIFSGKVNPNESLGSVFSIGKMFDPKWDWQGFWGLTAFFSLVLALMNLLPIPGLDGGHALFTLVEMISGRKPSDKFMEYAQMVGMVLLLGLMAYALGLDIFRMFK
ncbi:RIP metalloprotease RseP [Panacibacter ginsenosidivorans]|uniref:Zinc metalloprotease n=1 Tax=Panacibacter ginsenosidivorans TaxID=1813871 RepID=A0A5B8V8F2_9BACT|nr:RIP metalloprotease RseP [Panacibacter ginsenosidivorans]QEC67509.1 RIP metalloprotease RseP [Panacibacter ginsenosidivorans]